MSATAQARAHVGRNDPCPCGSGKKFKHCCLPRDAGAGPSAATPDRAPPSPALKQRLRTLFLAVKAHWDGGRWADAIPSCQEIARLDPNSPEAHHDLGATLFRCGRLAAAAASFQRAVDLRPGMERALRGLVEALEPQGRNGETLLACRKLSRAAADPFERRLYSAKALIVEGKPEEAETELRRMLALAPQRPETRVALGQVLANRGMFEEASRLLAQTLEASPCALGAFEKFSEVKRMSEADRPLLGKMRAVAERPDLEPRARISLHFGLGKAFDDLGDYPEAIRHYDAANRLKGMSARLDRPALAARYDSYISAFTGEALSRQGRALARPACPGDDMPVFIVGMPRSGTTLVEQILSSHPAVAAAGELSFWHQRLAGWRASRNGVVDTAALSGAAEDYRSILQGVGPGAQRVTDKAPSNYELLWLIRLAFPEARIIHCRRNPIDTCLSIYFTNFQARQDYAWSWSDLAFFYRQYERLMDHWRRALPADRFTEMDYETLIADRESETRRLIAFLGLDWNDACLAPERNNRTVRTASMWQARQPVYKTSLERWRRYEPWLGELRELLSPEAVDARS